MYPPQPVAAVRPPSAVHACVALSIASVGLLVEVFGAFTLGGWEDSSGTTGLGDPTVRGMLYGYLGWGMLLVILLMLGAVLVLRARPAGRVLSYVVGIAAMLGALGCGIGAGVIAGGPYEDMGDDWPPQWIGMIALIGSIVVLGALVFAFVALGRRTTTMWLKPPMPAPAPYYQVQQPWQG